MHHQRRFFNCYLALAISLTAPIAMEAGAISVNGTCYVGTCAAVDSLSNGQSTSGSFNFDYNFADGDDYNVSGTYSASYSTILGSAIAIDPTVSYMGVAPSSDTDVLNIMMLQNYFDTSCCTWAGTYSESVPLTATGSFGAGSQMSGELFYDGVGVGLAGPFSSPGTYLVTTSSNLDFGPLDTSDTLSASFDFQFTMGAGTAPGAGDSANSTPEPASMALCGFGLLVLIFAVYRRNQSLVSAK